MERFFLSSPCLGLSYVRTRGEIDSPPTSDPPTPPPQVYCFCHFSGKYRLLERGPTNPKFGNSLLRRKYTENQFRRSLGGGVGAPKGGCFDQGLVFFSNISSSGFYFVQGVVFKV